MELDISPQLKTILVAGWGMMCTGFLIAVIGVVSTDSMRWHAVRLISTSIGAMLVAICSIPHLMNLRRLLLESNRRLKDMDVMYTDRPKSNPGSGRRPIAVPSNGANSCNTPGGDGGSFLGPSSHTTSMNHQPKNSNGKLEDTRGALGKLAKKAPTRMQMRENSPSVIDGSTGLMGGSSPGEASKRRKASFVLAMDSKQMPSTPGSFGNLHTVPSERQLSKRTDINRVSSVSRRVSSKMTRKLLIVSVIILFCTMLVVGLNLSRIRIQNDERFSRVYNRRRSNYDISNDASWWVSTIICLGFAYYTTPQKF